MVSVSSSFDRIFGRSDNNRLLASLVTPRFSKGDTSLHPAVAAAGAVQKEYVNGLSRRTSLTPRRESPICLSPTSANREVFGKGFSRHRPPPISKTQSQAAAIVRPQSPGAQRMMSSDGVKSLLSQRDEDSSSSSIISPALEETPRPSRVIAFAGRRSSGGRNSTAANYETPIPSLRTSIRTFTPDNSYTSATRSQLCFDTQQNDKASISHQPAKAQKARKEHNPITGDMGDDTSQKRSDFVVFPAAKVASVPFVSPVPLKSRGHSAAALSKAKIMEHGPHAYPWDDGRPKVNPNGIYPSGGSENDWLKKAGYSQRKHHTKPRTSSLIGQDKEKHHQALPKMRTPSKNSPMRVKDTMQLDGELPKDEIYANPQRRHYKQPKTGRPSISREFKRQIFPSDGGGEGGGESITLLDDVPTLPSSAISTRYTNNKSRSSPTTAGAAAPWR